MSSASSLLKFINIKKIIEGNYLIVSLTVGEDAPFQMREALGLL